MSSNIRVQKICEYCGEEYTAKTLVTRFCSNVCNRKDYKYLKRQERLNAYNKKQTETNAPTEILNNMVQEYYELGEAALIMRVSKRTLHRLIAQRKLKKKKLLARTVIMKDDIRIFFAAQ
jgi:predicted DNA-binding protein (UPF0251 family)